MMKLILLSMILCVMSFAAYSQDTVASQNASLFKKRNLSIYGYIDPGYGKINVSNGLSAGGIDLDAGVGVSKCFDLSKIKSKVKVTLGVNLMAGYYSESIPDTGGLTLSNKIQLLYLGFFGGVTYVYDHYYAEDFITADFRQKSNSTFDTLAIPYSKMLYADVFSLGICGVYSTTAKHHKVAKKEIHSYKIGLFIAPVLNNVFGSNANGITANLFSFGVRWASN